jgi:O-antigen/teichoic acid export membrane protein
MEKAYKMGKISATGSIQLFIGKSLSTLIMAVGTIILGRIMLTSDYGLYTIALVPSITMNLFDDWGINVAASKFIAQYKVANDEKQIRDIVVTTLLFKAIIGIVLSLLSLFFASFIATTIFKRPESADLIYLASVTILSTALLNAAQSIFVGFESMNLHSFTMICQAVAKSTITPLLVIVGYGTAGAVFGYTISLVFAALVSVVLIYFFIFKKLGKDKSWKVEKTETLVKMLRFGAPTAVATIISGLLPQFYAFLMAFYCSDVMVANYQIALNFTLLLSFFSFPIATVLYPAFSKLDAQNEPKILEKVYVSSAKYTAFLIIPATLALMILSHSLIYTLYDQQYVYAPFFLMLSVTVNLLSGLGNLSLGSLLLGIGETKTIMKFSLVTLVTGVSIAVLLVPQLGITGLILGNVISGIPSLALQLRWVWKRFKFTTDWLSSSKIFVASTIAAVVTYIFINMFQSAEWLDLIGGGLVFFVTYLVVAPSIGAVLKDDIINLKSMLSGLGIISKMINLALGVAEKVANTYSKSRKR